MMVFMGQGTVRGHVWHFLRYRQPSGVHNVHNIQLHCMDLTYETLAMSDDVPWSMTRGGGTDIAWNAESMSSTDPDCA